MDQYTLNIFVQIGVALATGFMTVFIALFLPYKLISLMADVAVYLFSRIDLMRANKKRKNTRVSAMIVREWNLSPENRRFRMNEWIRGYESAMHGEKLENYLAIEDNGSPFARIQRTAFVDGYRYYNLEGGDDLKGQPIIDLHQHQQEQHQRLMTG